MAGVQDQDEDEFLTSVTSEDILLILFLAFFLQIHYIRHVTCHLGKTKHFRNQSVVYPSINIKSLGNVVQNKVSSKSTVVGEKAISTTVDVSLLFSNGPIAPYISRGKAEQDLNFVLVSKLVSIVKMQGSYVTVFINILLASSRLSPAITARG